MKRFTLDLLQKSNFDTQNQYFQPLFWHLCKRSIIALSFCIHEFKKGNEANNLESAIAGYEIAATALTRESTPEEHL